jgi:hypothetical protein
MVVLGLIALLIAQFDRRLWQRCHGRRNQLDFTPPCR